MNRIQTLILWGALLWVVTLAIYFGSTLPPSQAEQAAPATHIGAPAHPSSVHFG